MLENFQLALIAKSGAQMRLLRVPLHQALQASLAESWAQQYAAFVAGIQEVDFNAGYTPEERKRLPVPPTQSGMNQVLTDSRNGSSSSIWLFGQVGSFSSVSRSHAAGSRPFSRAVPIRL